MPKIKNKLRMFEARPFFKNYIMLEKICVSFSMCLEHDYICVVLRIIKGFHGQERETT